VLLQLLFKRSGKKHYRILASTQGTKSQLEMVLLNSQARAGERPEIVACVFFSQKMDLIELEAHELIEATFE
jgi:hypothetical protein